MFHEREPTAGASSPDWQILQKGWAQRHRHCPASLLQNVGAKREHACSLPCVFCLVVQGEKEVMLEDETYRYAASEFLVVSVDLPATGHVTVATPEKPYPCLQADIDPKQLSDLITEMGRTEWHAAPAERALFIGKTNDQLTDVVLRLARLLETLQDIPILAPMVIRESYYRLLNGSYGRRIAQIAIKGTNKQRIEHVIQMVKTKFSEAVRVEDLAEMAHVSSSSFRFHIKEVTSMSPLQYQKRLRLLEA
jgi:AraC-type transcriptional regulator N-terminus